MNNKKVTIYTTPSCTYCHQTKEFFNEKGVRYEEHDVAADIERRQEMMQKSGQLGVPVITIAEADDSNEEIVVGFDQGRLAQLLGL